MATPYQKLEKIISTKQTFADLAYKEYRSSKYGMTFCCPTNFNNHTNVNEICDWEDNSKTLYNESTYTFTTWNWADWVSNGNGAPPSWVRTIMPDSLVDQYTPHNWVYRMTPSTATTANQLWSNVQYEIPNCLSDGSGDNMTIQFSSAQLDAICNAIDAARGTTRIYIVGFQNDDKDWVQLTSTPNVGSTDTSRMMVRKALQEKVRLPATAAQYSSPTVPFNISRLFLIHDMYIMNKTTTLIPASGDLNVICFGNTNGPGQLINGAIKSDRMMLLVDSSGDWSDYVFVGQGNLADGASTNIFDRGLTNAIFQPGTSPVGFLAGGGMSFNAIKPRLNEVGASSEDSQTFRASTHYSNAEYVGDEFFVDYDTTKDKARLSFGRCSTDAEEIIILVKDKNGAVVKDYDVMIDNTYYGKTDAAGYLITTLLNASVDTKHIINGCKCFTTTGGCNQQKIDIVLSDVVTPVCTNLAIDCL